MSSVIGNIIVHLTAKDSVFRRAMARNAEAVLVFEKYTSSAISTITKYGAGLAAAAGITGVGYMIHQQLALVDSTSKAADRLGLTTEALQGLRHAANLTGVEMNTVDMALQRMTRRLAQAAVGTGEALPALQRLGLEAQTLARLSPDKAMLVLADSLASVKSQSERVALAFKLFDSEGVKLVNTLQGGSAALQSMMDEAKSLGIAFSRELGAKVEAANDAIARMRATTQGLFIHLVGELAPYLKAVADRFTAISLAGDGVAIRVREGFSLVITVVSKVADVAQVMVIAWKSAQLGMGLIILGIVETINILVQATKATMDFFGVEMPSNVADATATMAQGFRETIRGMHDELAALSAERWHSENAERFLRDIEEAASKSADAIARATAEAQAQSQAASLGNLLDSAAAPEAIASTGVDAVRITEAIASGVEKVLLDRSPGGFLSSSPTAALEGSASAAAAIAQFRNDQSNQTVEQAISGSLSRNEMLLARIVDLMEAQGNPQVIQVA